MPMSKRFAVPCNCAGREAPTGDVVEGNRYAEARPNAAAMIAADWSGGAIKTSFLRRPVPISGAYTARRC